MLVEISQRLFESLSNSKNAVVFCESCTAGLAAASLGRFPGASKVLTGSLVVYQTAAKHDWLQLDDALLNSPEIGPVSELVTGQLAKQALRRSSTATLAAAITGHLGPSVSIAQYDTDRRQPAPAKIDDQDGTIFIAIANSAKSICHRFQLMSPSPTSMQDHEGRYRRQIEATEILYRDLLQFIEAEYG